MENQRNTETELQLVFKKLLEEQQARETPQIPEVPKFPGEQDRPVEARQMPQIPEVPKFLREQNRLVEARQMPQIPEVPKFPGEQDRPVEARQMPQIPEVPKFPGEQDRPVEVRQMPQIPEVPKLPTEENSPVENIVENPVGQLIEKQYEYLQEACGEVKKALDTLVDDPAIRLTLEDVTEVGKLNQLTTEFGYRLANKDASFTPNINQLASPPTPDEQEELPLSKRILSAVFNLLFYSMLVVAVVAAILLAPMNRDGVPRQIMGYSMMTVLTGSMEPGMPVRSLIAIGPVDQHDLEVGDVVTYLRDNYTTVTHRIIEIIENYQGSRDRGFRLQGDANTDPDFDIVRGPNVLGRVIFVNHFLGQMIFFIQDQVILVCVMVLLVVILIPVLKNYFSHKKEEEQANQHIALDQAMVLNDNYQKNEEEASLHAKTADEQQTEVRSFRQESEAKSEGEKKKLSTLYKVVLVSFSAVLIISAYQLISIFFTYQSIEQLSTDIRESYVVEPVADVGLDEGDIRLSRRIDWDALLARNADVVGWIYVPGTNIDYPILAGATNETYLHTDIDGNHSIAGSIFLEENNAPDFNDLNTIIYGHNMHAGNKFSMIDEIARGNFEGIGLTYVYVFLPNHTVNVYQIVAAQITDIFSEIYHLPVEDLEHFYELMSMENVMDATFDLSLDERALSRVLTLSTCAEAGATPVRSVVFAMLIEEVELTESSYMDDLGAEVEVY